MQNESIENPKVENSESVPTQALALAEGEVPNEPERPILSGQSPYERELTDRLCEPFPPEWLSFFPKVITKTNEGHHAAMFIFYVKSDLIEERLDAVFGPTNWEDTYQILGNGCVICKISANVKALDGSSKWVSKSDVGSPSDQEDEADRYKAAFTDSIKRAGSKWGICRYLKRVKPIWMPVEVKTGKSGKLEVVEIRGNIFEKFPQELAPRDWTPRRISGHASNDPGNAKSKPQSKPAQSSAPAGTGSEQKQNPPASEGTKIDYSKVDISPNRIPKPGKEFVEWLYAKDWHAANVSVINQGDLVREISDLANRAKYTYAFEMWNENDIKLCMNDVASYLAIEERKPGKLLSRINAYNESLLKAFPNSAADFKSFCLIKAQSITDGHPLASLRALGVASWPNTDEVRAWVAIQASEYNKLIKSSSKAA